jgi:hypothetical protein
MSERSYTPRVLSALLDAGDRAAQRYIVDCAAQSGSVAAAAPTLGVSLRTLQRWLATVPEPLRARVAKGASEMARRGRLALCKPLRTHDTKVIAETTSKNHI